MRKLLLRCALVCGISLPLGGLALAWLALDGRPQVTPGGQLTAEQIHRAKSWAKTHDPRGAPDGATRTLTVAGDDLELLANHFLGRYQGGAKLVLQPGALTFWASAPVPRTPLGEYVNVQGALRQTAGLPVFDELRIGRVRVPVPLADWLLARALTRLPAAGEGEPAIELVQQVQIAPSELQVVYRWRKELPAQLREAALPEADVARLAAFQQRLAEVTAVGEERELPLAALLGPLFGSAAERSQQSDPAAENRAALVVLAFYVNQRDLAAALSQAAAWPRPRRRTVVLGGRHDLAQHFSVSAALAACAGSSLADAIGVAKEVDDSRGGSGFSFPDLMADRAGTTFGARAIQSPRGARALQQRLAAGAAEADFMPAFADLPEGMNESEFQRRFGGLGAPAYQRMQAEIERRVGELPLHR